MPDQSKLTNGLRLILSPLRSTEAVTVLVLFPVGSRYESPELNGVSHFVEHLMFKGTVKRPTSLDVSRELDAIGAEYNAFTSKDHTGYYVKLAADQIELAFDLLSDMLLNSTFPAEEIEKERNVIIEEINMYDDNPLMLIDSIWEETLFPNHPLGQQIAGPKTVIQKVTRDQIIAYRQKFYGPSTTVVSVAGNFKSAQAKRLAKKYFGVAAPKLKSTAYAPITISQRQPQVTIRKKETEQVQLCLGFPGYKLEHPKSYALALLSVILGGNMSSRLFVTVREEHGLAYSIHAEASGYQDTGTFMVQAGLDRSRLEQAVALILKELGKVRDHGVTAKELKDAKQFLHGKMVLGLEDSEAIAAWYGRQATLIGKLTTPEQRLRKIKAVSLADVRKVAAELIRLPLLNVAAIGPIESDEKIRASFQL